MFGEQRRQLEADRRAVDDPPDAADHHPVGAMGAAQHQGGERVVRAGEARPWPEPPNQD